MSDTEKVITGAIMGENNTDAHMRSWYSGNPSNLTGANERPDIEQLLKPGVVDVLQAVYDYGRSNLDESREHVAHLRGLLETEAPQIDPDRGSKVTERLGRLANRLDDVADKYEAKPKVPRDHSLLEAFKQKKPDVDAFGVVLREWIHEGKIDVSSAMQIAQQAGKHVANMVGSGKREAQLQITDMYDFALFPRRDRPAPDFTTDKPDKAKTLLAIGQEMSIGYLRQVAEVGTDNDLAFQVVQLDNYNRDRFQLHLQTRGLLLPDQYHDGYDTDSDVTIVYDESVRHMGVIFSALFEDPSLIATYLGSQLFHKTESKMPHDPELAKAITDPLLAAAFYRRLAQKPGQPLLEQAIEVSPNVSPAVKSQLEQAVRALEAQYAALKNGTAAASFMSVLVGFDPNTVVTDCDYRTLEKFGAAAS